MTRETQIVTRDILEEDVERNLEGTRSEAQLGKEYKSEADAKTRSVTRSGA